MSDGADFNGLPEFGDCMNLEKNSEKMENWGRQHWDRQVLDRKRKGVQFGDPFLAILRNSNTVIFHKARAVIPMKKTARMAARISFCRVAISDASKARTFQVDSGEPASRRMHKTQS